MLGYIKKMFVGIFMFASISCLSACNSKEINEEGTSQQEVVDSIVSVALEDMELKLNDYIDVSYFANLQNTTNIMCEGIEKLSSSISSESEIIEIENIQYEKLTTSISGIFDSLTPEEYGVFESLSQQDEDIATMMSMIENDFSEYNMLEENQKIDNNIKGSNVLKLSTGVITIASILSSQNVCSAGIVAIKGAFNSMIASLKAFFVPNSVKAVIITAAILVIATVVIVNWNKIKPVIDKIVNVFVDNAKKFATTVKNVFNTICQSATDASEKAAEEVQEDIDDLLEDSEKGRETSGKSEQYLKKGGFEQAQKDFDSLNPSDVKDINTSYGKGKTGVLKDGSKVNVRPGSTYGEPTLEIQLPNGKRIKIRYGD